MTDNSHSGRLVLVLSEDDAFINRLYALQQSYAAAGRYSLFPCATDSPHAVLNPSTEFMAFVLTLRADLEDGNTVRQSRKTQFPLFPFEVILRHLFEIVLDKFNTFLNVLLSLLGGIGDDDCSFVLNDDLFCLPEIGQSRILDALPSMFFGKECRSCHGANVLHCFDLVDSVRGSFGEDKVKESCIGLWVPLVVCNKETHHTS